MNAPAGWYDDGSGRQRWWDGSQWTEHFYAQAEAAASAQPADIAPAGAAAPVAPAADAAPFAPPYVMAIGATTPGADVAAAVPAHPGYAQPFSPSVRPTPRFPVLGVIGLCIVGLGIVLSCIPPIAAAGWVALGAGFVLSIASLFLRSAKWPGVVALGATGLGAVLATAVALISFTAPVTSVSPDAGGSSAEGGSTLDDDSKETVPTDPGEIEGAEMTAFADLEVGDCIPLIDYGDDMIYELPVVPCDTPHTDEVFFIFDVEDGEFPGDESLEETAWSGCLAEFERYVGLDYDDSELDFYTYQPTKSSWSRWDDRTVQCILYSIDDVTGTLAGTAR
ncbi:hypothetical protein QFZ53_003115 [Microbacterium natoriense]|uniref:DUF2510 domain-containing protein n=1 Tax=Microbacterium natoriense TaxID=284570 RepID=A0AAW8F1J7_9MICO|nr:DUF2510 domain-containing protein [Microbacterium natoriense]MDQ0648919.1 hypothetical protein [Microbacterium natoriense]